MSCPECGRERLHWCFDQEARDGTAILRDGHGTPCCDDKDLRYAGRDGIDKAPDMVNHPPHYTAGTIECIDAIRQALGLDQFVGYCRGNAIKYLWRTGKKGYDYEDLRKAAWYCAKAADTLEMTDE